MNKRKRVLVIVTMWFMTLGLWINPVKVVAASNIVTPVSALLYTGSGAELFSDADVNTCMMALPGNMPINVTGMTSNGFFQVLIDGSTYYMYGKGLSTQTGTTAYTLTNVNAKAALVGDAETGNLIYAQDAMTRLEPASTTKIMTALLVMEAVTRGDIALDTPVVITPTSLAGLPSDASHVTPRLKSGEVMNILMLLEAMMVESDCYASNVLAEAVAGSKENFTVLMNARAVELGCVDTNFVNASGYPDRNHYTNAYSLFLITKEAMKYPVFQYIVSLPTVKLPATNLVKERTLKNTNALIINSDYHNSLVTGGKTGTANRAGSCLVATATKGDKNIITVVLGAASRKMTDGIIVRQQFAETNKLVDIGFAALGK